MATILALISIYFFVLHLPESIILHGASFAYVVGLSQLLCFIALMTPVLCWSSIQRAEQKVFPRVSELICKDYGLCIALIEIVIFLLYSLYMVTTVPEAGVPLVSFLLWIVLLGISIDCTYFFTTRFFRYTQHPFLLRRVDRQVVKLVRAGKDKEAFQWMETTIEVVARAADRKNIHIAKDALRATLSMCEHFVKEASTAGVLRSVEQSGPSLLDEVSYLSAYICRRLDWLGTLAAQNHFDPISEDIVNTLGKMSLFFARYNPQIAKLPLLFIERAAKTMLQQERDELATQFSCTLSEVAKGLIILSYEKQESRKETVIAAIQHLEAITTLVFQKNRNTNPALLMQPFAEIAQLLGNSLYAAIADREVIISELRRILQSYGALEQIIAKLQQ